MRDPKTPAEWQEAVDAARFFLLIDSARQYGLLVGGPRIYADRCEAILERGLFLGYQPRSDDALLGDYLPIFSRPGAGDGLAPGPRWEAWEQNN